MSKFTNLKKFEIDPNKSIEYPLVDIQMNGKTPFFMVKPATEVNKPFARAQLLRSNKRMKVASARGATLEIMDANRKDDEELYPQFIITGWGNVFDQGGKEVPYSKKECVEFLEELPNWIFDQLRIYCTAPTNFSDNVDGGELGK